MVQEEIGNIRPVMVEDEMRNSYLDYAMSVITSRALPDVRDGLKPAQRRILVAMHDLNLAPNRGYRKCAKIAGDTSGNYHPHGEAVVYPTLVRMAQPFNMRYPLVDGQGNFGSVDGDPPAAMRYTEARLTPLAMEMLADIDMDTVDQQANYDGTREEPVVLPGRFPNLLCNGSAGIAVGMATNMAPHNLGEVVDALTHLVDHPESTVDELLRFIKGPDFPTGGIVLGREKDRQGLVVDNIKQAYATGRGRVVVRARTEIEETKKDRYAIVVTELPYQVNKSTLQERIAELVREKRIEGISAMQDESDRTGMRLVIEVKRDADPNAVLNSLFKFTAMEQAFNYNMLALVEGEPRVLTLKRLLQEFLDYRHSVLTRRTQYELRKAQARAHILEGLKIALDNLDEVIRTIRQAESAEAARGQLIARFGLSEIQARAILDMQLRQLANLERQKILDEYQEIMAKIAHFEDLLAHPHKILLLVRDELAAMKNRFGDKRRTEIRDDFIGEITEEDLVANEQVLITVSSRNYVKRMPAHTYKVQRRGGRGIIGQVLREEDALRHMTVANSRDSVLFFTDRGRVFQLKAWQVPKFDRTARGIPLINVIQIEPDENVTAILPAPDFENSDFLVFATRRGLVKKTGLKAFSQVRANGLRAMNLRPGDELLDVKHCAADADVILVNESGRAARFSISRLRSASRISGGVRGMRLAAHDALISMDVVQPDEQLLLVSANGFGKRTPLSAFPAKGRGTQGVRAFRISEKTGPLAKACVADGTEELMLISAGGIVMRTTLETVSVRGRNSSGVKVMRFAEDDRLAAMALIQPTNGENGVEEPADEVPEGAEVIDPSLVIGDAVPADEAEDEDADDEADDDLDEGDGDDEVEDEAEDDEESPTA